MLSKEGRRKIIEVLVSERGEREVAELLDVSKAALSKFLSGKTHPRDALIEKAIEIAEGEEREKIILIIAEDLASFAEEFSHLIRESAGKAKNAEILRVALKEMEEATAELKKILEE